MVFDYWAHAHVDDPKLRDEIVATGFEEDLAELEMESKPRDGDSIPDDDWEDVV